MIAHVIPCTELAAKPWSGNDYTLRVNAEKVEIRGLVSRHRGKKETLEHQRDDGHAWCAQEFGREGDRGGGGGVGVGKKIA